MVCQVLYADGGGYENLARDVITATKDMFDMQILYSKDVLNHDGFYDKNKHILSQKRYAGYCLWKPYVILRTLNQLEDGDVVFYMDSGDFIYKDIRPFIIDSIAKNDGFMLVQSIHPHIQYCTSDCFILMDCNYNQYRELNQLEAGCCAFRKQPSTIKFLEEWLFWCEKDHVITDDIVYPNPECFIESRADQMALTNLCKMWDLPTIDIYAVKEYIHFNIDKLWKP